MYSYQHRYHAGSFADLHKHVILLALLETLQKKDSPFCVLDAFAGEGFYDLNSKESQKNQEFMQGFAQARKASNAPPLVQELLDIAKAYQIEDQTFMYPGSPAIIQAKLRAQDQGIFIENHPHAYKQLKRNFGRVPQMHIHRRDGLEAIQALVPFKEKRGLIFIDPSYEIKEEYKSLCDVIQQAYLKFAQGTYMLWYPLLRERRHVAMLAKLQRALPCKIWRHEMQFRKPDQQQEYEGLYGSGAVVINPPWQLDQTMQANLKFFRSLVKTV